MSEQNQTGIYYADLSAEEMDAEVVSVEPDRYRRERIRIEQPEYFNDDEVCGYCGRLAGRKHETWCRQ